MTMHITVLGTEYEGLSISVGLATVGHIVTTIDSNPGQARRLQRGVAVGDDAELSKQMKLVLREGSLKFTSEPESSLAEADVVIIAGITGIDPNAVPDRTAVLRTVECLSGAIASYSTVIVMAPIPIGGCQILQDWLNNSLHTGAAHVVAFPVCFTPPNGLHEFLHPDRIVLGYENEGARRVVDELFAYMLQNHPLVCHVSWEAVERMQTTCGEPSVEIPTEETPVPIGKTD